MYHHSVLVLVILFSTYSLQQCPPTESFENGYNGWVLVDLSSPLFPAIIGSAGQDVGFSFFTSQPTDGSMSFVNGFDAGDPSNLTLTKTLTIGNSIQFDYRYAWDLTSYCSEDCRPRYFIVNFYSTTSVLLQSNQILETTYTVLSDSGIQTATIDTAPLSGQSVQMQFLWVIPQSSTGPAFFELDNIRFSNCTPAFTCTPSCQNGGTCIATNTCSCPGNYTGNTCEYRIATPELPFTPTGECPSMASSALSSPVTFSDPVPYGHYVIGSRLRLNITTFCTSTNITATLNGVAIGTQAIGPLCTCNFEEILFDVFLDHWNSAYFYGKSNNTLIIEGDNLAWTSPVLDLYISNASCPDNIAPIINVCPSPVTLTASSVSCDVNIPDFVALAEGVDDCGFVFVSQNQTAGSAVSPGVYSIGITFSDYYGASSTCATQVTVEDISSPSISCPDPVTLFADNSCQAVLPSLLSSVNASDACSVSKSQNPTASSVLSYGLSYINATATDPSGNSASCQIAVDVQDVTNPSVTCPSDITISACDYTAENFTSQLVFSDNCGIVSLSQSPAVGQYLAQGTHLVTVTLIDIAGNQGSCTFNVHVVDSVNPNITCDAPLVLPVDDECQVPLPNVTGAVSAEDDCILFLTQDPTADSQLFTTGNYSVNVTAADLRGNNVACEKQIQVIDAILPVVQCTAELTIQVDAFCQASVPSIQTYSNFSDNCGISQLVQSPTAGSVHTLGNHTVTLTASDYFDNQASCNTVLHVIDTIFPVITCPNTIVINASEICQAVFPDFMALVTASDNCDYNLTQYPAVGTPLGLGEFIVTVRVTDYDGNFQECNSSVVVVDVSEPVLSPCVPARVHQRTDCDIDQTQSEIPSFIVDGFELASENCNLTQVIQEPLPGTKVPLGVYNITLTFIDVSGNMMSCMTNYTYEEKEPASAAKGMSRETVIGLAAGIPGGMAACSIIGLIMYFKNMLPNSPKFFQPNLDVSPPNAQDLLDKVTEEAQKRIEDIEMGREKEEKEILKEPRPTEEPVGIKPVKSHYDSDSDTSREAKPIRDLDEDPRWLGLNTKSLTMQSSGTHISIDTPDSSESE